MSEENKALPAISIVVPLYNEEESFSFLVQRLNTLMENSSFAIEILLVNDGSKDSTPMLMQQIAFLDKRYQCVFLSRNFGHQVALSAGLTCARATEGVMVIDGDLQDPPELLDKFYEEYKKGFDVIYGVRAMRNDEGLLKKMTSKYFYKTLSKMADTEIPQNSGDFCFMSRRVVDVLNKMPEQSRFIRGMRAWVGFKQKGIEFDREQRVAGSTKYPLSKMIRFAYNGIFNFSEIPIKFITFLGLTSIVIAIIYLGYTIFKKIVYDNVIEGFTGLLMALILFSGVQLISLGIIGEYVVRIFFQTKERPLFVIKNRIVDGEITES